MITAGISSEVKRNIRMIALDLDGTLLHRDKTLSSETREALEAAMREGIHVALASGRSFSALPETVLGIPGIEYAITSNGAAIYSLKQGQRIKEFLLDPETVEMILAMFPEHQALEAFVDGIPYAWSDYVEDPKDYVGTPAGVTYVQSTRTPVKDIRGFIREHRRELDSLDILVKNQAQHEEYRRRLSKVQDIYVTSSVTELIEISHHKAGKASGIHWIADHLEIDMRQTAAFGDAENDRDMLLAAGIGTAVANASAAAKEAADCVTLSNDEDGVALVIREILESRR